MVMKRMPSDENSALDKNETHQELTADSCPYLTYFSHEEQLVMSS